MCFTKLPVTNCTLDIGVNTITYAEVGAAFISSCALATQGSAFTRSLNATASLFDAISTSTNPLQLNTMYAYMSTTLGLSPNANFLSPTMFFMKKSTLDSARAFALAAAASSKPPRNSGTAQCVS